MASSTLRSTGIDYTCAVLYGKPPRACGISGLEEVGGVVGECRSSEYRDEIDVGGGEVGEEKFAYDKVGRVCWENRCKVGKPWKEIVLVGVTGKLYLLIKLTLLLSIRGKVKHGRKSSDISFISNLPKPTYTAESAVSDFYAFILAIHKANEVRRTNNGAFNAMTDEEDH
ncbi:hypothetical protein T02_6782 [Trichinella nativa]|uniref:Uncharacterized protein n=1 Tax=Trichinella nativa TaxID=6335 RepID=A0A0V1KMT8_9BILA|nr:hypothetical protein T02_6782 [Trichinella nativa]